MNLDNSAKVSPSAEPRTKILNSMFNQRITFNSVLNNELSEPLSLASFEIFLRTKEHSEENLEFLRAAQAYRKLYEESNAKLKAQLNDLISNYLMSGAPHEINCPNKIRAKLLNDIQSDGIWDPSVLKPAEDKIHELMRLSSFPHFLRHVEESLEQETVGNQ